MLEAKANAVKKKPVTKYKISFEGLKAYGVCPLVPVASNKTDEGMAKKRQIELVEQ
jgi:OOP family OmpA-OmpF porin